MSGPIITLDGNRYVLRGPLVLQPITEFNTAVRQGSPTRDDRNLASFFVLEDSRAGIGLRSGNVREDPDKLADSDGVLAFKFDELIKPPQMNTAALSGATKGMSATAVLREYDVDGTVRLYMGFGTQVWYSDGSSMTMAETSGTDALTTGDVTGLIVYEEPTSGQRRLWVANNGNEDISYLTDPTAVSPFTAVSSKKFEDFFEFDGKLFGMGRGILEWSINPTSTWNSLAATGAWPYRWKFIGVFPFGETFYPYVLIHHDDPTRARVAVLDTDSNSIYPLSLEESGIIDAFPHEGVIAILHDNGRDVTLYDPFGRERRELDWRAQQRDGFLSNRDSLAVGGTNHHGGLFVVANAIGSTNAQLFQHRTTGWHPYGKAVAGDAIAQPKYVVHLNKVAFPVKPAGTDLQLNHIDWWDEAFLPGANQSVAMESANLSAITPWFALGFSELAGPLLSITCGGYFDANNQVTVEYQTNLDESAWTTLGTFPNTSVPGTPEITGRSTPVEQTDTLLFNALVGVSFERVRLRVTLISSLANQTPNAYPLIIRFFKRPPSRESYRLEIDVLGTLGARDDLTTVADLWKELKAIYDKETVPAFVGGGITTWAVLIGLPRVLVLDEASLDDVELYDIPQDAAIVVNLAELV